MARDGRIGVTNVDHHVMHTPTSCNTQPNLNLPTSTNNIMSHNDRIEAALADLESQEVPNYSMTYMFTLLFYSYPPFC